MKEWITVLNNFNETFDSFDLFAFAESRKYDLKSSIELRLLKQNLHFSNRWK